MMQLPKGEDVENLRDNDDNMNDDNMKLIINLNMPLLEAHLNAFNFVSLNGETFHEIHTNWKNRKVAPILRYLLWKIFGKAPFFLPSPTCVVKLFPMIGFYQTRSGRFLHIWFNPLNREDCEKQLSTMRRLGIRNRAELLRYVESGTSKDWVFECEQKLGEYATAVRTRKEWRELCGPVDEPLYRITEYKHASDTVPRKPPLYETQKLCRTTRNPSTSNSNQPTNQKFLAGLRVLDLSRVVAGPYSAKILADLGASVTPVWHSNWKYTLPATIQVFQKLGKLPPIFLKLDLNISMGVGAWYELDKLLEESDVVITNLNVLQNPKLGGSNRRSSVMKPNEDCRTNRILQCIKNRASMGGFVHLNITAFSLAIQNKYFGRKGYAPMVGAASGFVHASRSFSYLESCVKRGEPCAYELNTWPEDYLPGLIGAFGILDALAKQRESGNWQSYLVDSSLAQGIEFVMRNFTQEELRDSAGFLTKDELDKILSLVKTNSKVCGSSAQRNVRTLESPVEVKFS